MGFAYSTAGWANFFVAEVGASAALVGLLFEKRICREAGCYLA